MYEVVIYFVVDGVEEELYDGKLYPYGQLFNI